MHKGKTASGSESTLVVADGDVVVALLARERPDALEPVVQSGLEPERGRVPDAHRAVLAAGEQQRQLRVERHRRHVLHVALERVHAALCLQAQMHCTIENKVHWWLLFMSIIKSKVIDKSNRAHVRVQPLNGSDDHDQIIYIEYNVSE